MLCGVVGFLTTFTYSDKLEKESMLKANKRRVKATLISSIVFVSCALFIFYPPLEGALAGGIVLFSISAGFTLTEWRIKAQRYDHLKNNSEIIL